jgi:NAD-dependent SIR2 family protein deacetylase
MVAESSKVLKSDGAGATVTTVVTGPIATATTPEEPSAPDTTTHYANTETFYWKNRGKDHVQLDKNDATAVDVAIAAAARAIDEANAVLILTGAGMGVDMGLADFRSSVAFWEALAHPEIKVYEDSSDSKWFELDPELAWGLNYAQVAAYRETAPHDGYRILRWLARQKDTWCYTSNIDGVLQRAGFDAARVHEKHGNIHRLQCTLGRKCPGAAGTWEARVEMEYDTANFRASSSMPKCNACGALARPNVWFCTDTAYECHRAASEVNDEYIKWADGIEAEGRKLVLIECGAGMVIPSCRIEAEDRGNWCRGTLVRINPTDYAVPRDGEEGAPATSIGIPMGSAEGLRQIAQRSSFLRTWREE